MAISDFALKREQLIHELDSLAQLYLHSSGARVLSLSNSDENKVFGISFRTPPEDSTGIAHILEHAVFCGSRKFPVKEPFVELLKGSLNTFLNALTCPDKTCYPVASQNLSDFYNLIDVYLDAVFYPRLLPSVLQQEGWHYQLKDSADPLEYSGVVYNEMKGAYSSPEAILSRLCQESLFPDNCYGFDYAGDPRHIPELSFEQFTDFHRRHYHPANSFIFFSGDDDPQERLRLLDDYLADFEFAEVASIVGRQPRFTAPRRIVEAYASSGDGTVAEKHMVVLNWLLEDGLNANTYRGLGILEYVLVGTSASPLRKGLIDSGLGEDLVATGLETELKQLCFSVGLRGVEASNVCAVECLIPEILSDLANTGFEAGLVEAAVNSTEFRLRENNTGSAPRGLILMMSALSNWLYDRDPLVALGFVGSLEWVKERLCRDAAYLQQLIRDHLLNNDHRTTVVLEPDAELAARLTEEEQGQLARARQEMDIRALETVVEANRSLLEAQQRPDSSTALATLPRLGLSDLDPEIRIIPIEVTEQSGCRVLYHDLPTNGIVYVDIGFDLSTLELDSLPYVPLFSRALLEMGTEQTDFVQLSQRIGAHTGGLWPQPFVTSQRHSHHALAWMFLRGKAVTSQVQALFDIIVEVLLNVRFNDRKRFTQLLLEEKAAEEADLVPGGHRAVNLRLRSCFEEASWISERMRGIHYLFFLRRLVHEVENNWPAVLDRLEEVRRRMVNRSGMLCNVTMGEKDRAVFGGRLDNLIEQIPTAPFTPVVWTPCYQAVDEGLVVPTQVNYVGKAGNLYDRGYKLHGSVAVVTRYLATTWLWDRVRVQGGAYGAHCSFDHFSGVHVYTSYCDPNLLETLNIYDGTGGFLRRLELSEEELVKAVIGAVGDLDAHQLPDARGYTSMVRYLTGVDDSFRQRMRDEVLATRPVHFSDLASVLDAMSECGRIVAMGSRETLEAVNRDVCLGLETVAVM